MTSGKTPLVFVTVGTDHHRFDRLVQWADAFADARPDVRVLVQHGEAEAPKRAEGAAYLDVAAVDRSIGDAVAVVCHGGPATIAAVLAAGKRPIVVPRRPELGEHVDGHQVRFTALIAAAGRVTLAASAEDLQEQLDRAVADPSEFAATDHAADTEATVRLFGDLVEALLE